MKSVATEAGDERLANSQALEIARATGQIVETLNDELKAQQLENLELRTLVHKLERKIAELPSVPLDLPKLPLRAVQ